MLQQSFFSREQFWQKLTRITYSAGRELLEKALWLYFAAKRPETPAWARSVIYGALGYLILPTDLIADFIPGAGYTDDLTVLASALGTVIIFVDDQVKRQTTHQLNRWFPQSMADNEKT